MLPMNVKTLEEKSDVHDVGLGQHIAIPWSVFTINNVEEHHHTEHKPESNQTWKLTYVCRKFSHLRTAKWHFKKATI